MLYGWGCVHHTLSVGTWLTERFWLTFGAAYAPTPAVRTAPVRRPPWVFWVLMVCSLNRLFDCCDDNQIISTNEF